MRARGKAVWAWAAATLLAHPAGAQVPELEALAQRVSEHAHGLAEEDGRLTGPGLDALLEAVEGSLFVAVGEAEAGSREVPRIVDGLLGELEGFEYLAVQADPFFVDRLQAPGFRGDLARMAALALRHPMSLATATYEELDLLARVMRDSRGRARPVWGLDLPSGALHLLDPLVEHAADEGLAGRILELREEVAAVESLRFGRLLDEDPVEEVPEEEDPFEDADPAELARAADYLGQRGDEALFRELREAYAPLPGSPEARWLEALALAVRLGPDAPERGEWIRERFLEQYREAEARGDREPRVVLKADPAHLARGLGPGGAPTLGSLLPEFAYLRGSRSVHVLALPAPPLEEELPEAFVPLVDGVPETGWTVVDLRPLRAEELRRAAPEVHEVLVRWDFLLVVRDPTAADPADLLRAAGVVEPEDPEPPEGAEPPGESSPTEPPSGVP